MLARSDVTADWNMYRIIARAQQGSVTSYRNTRHRDIFLGDQLVGAFVFSEVPNPDITPSITSYYLPLIWVDHHVINRDTVIVASLNAPVFRLPYLYPPIFRTSNHPFAFTMESDTGNIPRVPGESHDRTWI